MRFFLGGICAAVILLSGLFPSAARAAGGAGAALSEILVTGKRLEAPLVETRESVPRRAIERRDAVSVDSAMTLVPAAHIQTNSRGETLVFLRNAGERQVAVFFDGALLNVPWDNRVDLSLVPAGVIGGIEVATGATSIQYGANVVGGAVNLTPRQPAAAGPAIEARLRRGGDSLWQGSVTASGTAGRLRYLAHGGYFRHDGLPLPGGAGLAFNQIGTDVRTNTDLRAGNLLLRGALDVGPEAQMALTFLYLDAEKGVAPEGHLDPAVSNVRFWRYPQWTHAMAILSGEAAPAEGLTIKGSAWVQSFDQTIDSFESIAYEALDEKQRDDNLTVGARFTLRRDFGRRSLLISFNGLRATHRQRNIEFPGPAPAPRLVFRQHTISAGAEYEATVRPGLQFKAGLGIDWMEAPLTGDKPPIGDFVEYNATGGLVYRPGGDWWLRAGVGRKTRLPTLRELFGQAIDRFLINPALRSEASFIAEAAGGWEDGRFRLELIPFASFTSDTIGQRRVEIDGRNLRQRINLPDSRILGLEITGRARLSKTLALEGHVTAMDIHRKPRFPGDSTRLAEKPRVIGRAALDYDGPRGMSGLIEIEHRGRAFSRNEEDRFVPLAVSTSLNLRLALDLREFDPSLPDAQFYVRADNLADTVVEPQLGLPAAGRWVSGGFRVTF